MATSTWDETCPYCKNKISNLSAIFGGKYYAVEFGIECPHCKQKIEVSVRLIPEFELSKMPLRRKR